MSFNSSTVTKEVNKLLKIFFPESNLQLFFKNNKFFINGKVSSKAINNYENDRKEINVIQWFDNFWVYVDIKLLFNEFRNDFPNIFASISFFQGDEIDEIKNQLFRAEWDNYRDGNTKHPQPHWHIYPVQYHHQAFDEYLKATEEFVGFLSDERLHVIEIKRIHFAMNGQWDNGANEKSHHHEITEEKALVNWFIGLLNHIKTQLEYVS